MYGFFANQNNTLLLILRRKALKLHKNVYVVLYSNEVLKATCCLSPIIDVGLSASTHTKPDAITLVLCTLLFVTAVPPCCTRGEDALLSAIIYAIPPNHSLLLPATLKRRHSPAVRKQQCGVLQEH